MKAELTPEIRAVIDEYVAAKIEEIMSHHDSKATLLTSTEAAHKLSLPIARFQILAKEIPVVKFGKDQRKNWYRLHDLVDLVERHKMPPIK